MTFEREIINCQTHYPAEDWKNPLQDTTRPKYATPTFSLGGDGKFLYKRGEKPPQQDRRIVVEEIGSVNVADLLGENLIEPGGFSIDRWRDTTTGEVHHWHLTAALSMDDTTRQIMEGIYSKVPAEEQYDALERLTVTLPDLFMEQDGELRFVVTFGEKPAGVTLKPDERPDITAVSGQDVNPNSLYDAETGTYKYFQVVDLDELLMDEELVSEIYNEFPEFSVVVGLNLATLDVCALQDALHADIAGATLTEKKLRKYIDPYLYVMPGNRHDAMMG